MSDADPDRASDRLHEAIATVCRDEAPVMVTKWVCLVEVLGDDGQPQMWSLTSPGLAMWDRLGIVEFHSRAIQPQTGDE